MTAAGLALIEIDLLSQPAPFHQIVAVREGNAAVDFVNDQSMPDPGSPLASDEQLAIFRSMFLGSNVGICVVDEAGRFVMVNPAYCQIYDYTPEELIGTHFTRVMPTSRRKHAIALHDRFFEEGIARSSEWDVLTRSRKSFRINLHSVCVAFSGDRRLRVSTVTDVSEIRRTEVELRTLFDVIASTSHGVIFTDAAGKVTWVNSATERMTGFTLAELHGNKPGDVLQGPGSAPEVIQHMSHQLAAGNGFQVEILNYTKSRQPLYLHISCSPVRDTRGVLTGFMALQTDITQSREVQERLNRAAEDLSRYSIAVDQSPASIVITTVDGEIEYVNQTCLNVTGYTRAELIGSNPRIFKSGATPHAVYVDLWATISAGHTWHGRLKNKRKDGTEYLEAVSISPVLNEHGRVTSYIAVKEDITEREAMAAHIDAMARFDEVTGLLNRNAFLEELERRLSLLHESAGTQLLAIVNIDRFHSINDAQGHEVGDQVLESMARRLRSAAPQNCVVARIGADEFGMLVPVSNTSGENALPPAELGALLGIQQITKDSLQVGSRSLDISASIGVASCDHLRSAAAHLRPGKLLRMAESALHSAKARGGRQVVFYDKAATSQAQELIRLEQDLARALESGELQLVLQAQVDTSGRLSGAEALLRWRHHALGSVSPARFIPLAEESRQIIPIGYWVLKQALVLLQQIKSLDPALTLSVNVSPVQLRDEQFIPEIRRLVDESGAPAEGLIIEITERVFMATPELAQRRLQALRDLGIGIAIDDFGTGYSSLSYLKRLPVTELKIDQSFIAEMPNDEGDLALVKIIVAAASVRHLRVVAEGVETEEQANCLRDLPRVHIQGYLYDRPSEPAAWLTKWQNLLYKDE